MKRCYALRVSLLLSLLAMGCCPCPPPTAPTTLPANPPHVTVPPPNTPQSPSDDQVPGVRNFGVISAQVWRGERPTPQGYAYLKAMGVRTIINLEQCNDYLPDSLALNHVSIPTSSFHCDQVNVEALLQAIQNNPKPIFIHCREGRDRTGMAIAAYRLDQGMPLCKVKEELHNFHVHFWWQPFIEHRLNKIAHEKAERGA